MLIAKLTSYGKIKTMTCVIFHKRVRKTKLRQSFKILSDAVMWAKQQLPRSSQFTKRFARAWLKRSLERDWKFYSSVTKKNIWKLTLQEQLSFNCPGWSSITTNIYKSPSKQKDTANSHKKGQGLRRYFTYPDKKECKLSRNLTRKFIPKQELLLHL